MRKTKRWNRYRHITLCWVQKVITSPSPTTLGFSVCSSRQICCLTSTSLCTCPTPRSSLARCHWPHQIPITVNVNVYKCLHVTAPQSLYAGRSSSGRWHLHSADRGQLHTQRFRLSTVVGRSFAYAAPSTWNYLPDSLKVTALPLSSFRKQ